MKDWVRATIDRADHLQWFGWALIAATTLLLGVSAQAVTSISQGYQVEKPIPVGSLVSLTAETSDTVETATIENSPRLLGVVVTGGSSMLALGSGNDSEVQVATGGSARVLVSSINGAVKQGDQITASPIAGVGMKATGNAKVVGVAQSDMTKTAKEEVDHEGGKQTVDLGNVPVVVNVSYHYEHPEKTIIPAALQNVANAMAGRQVEPLPIIVSAALFIIMLAVVMSIVFAMIRSSIISVGRNPLAQSAVWRNVIQLSGLVILIVIGCVGAIYFMLRVL